MGTPRLDVAPRVRGAVRSADRQRAGGRVIAATRPERLDDGVLHHVGGVVTLELNGEVTAVIEGDDFARAFFGIWLSEHALSDSLRDRLLAAAD